MGKNNHQTKYSAASEQHAPGRAACSEEACQQTPLMRNQPGTWGMLAHSMDPCSPSEEFPHHPLSVSVTLPDWKHERIHCCGWASDTVSPELSSLPANISAPTMVPTPSRQTNTATKWITLYLARRINQDRAINTGIPKQSKSCREGKRAASNISAAWNKEAYLSSSRSKYLWNTDYGRPCIQVLSLYVTWATLWSSE